MRYLVGFILVCVVLLLISQRACKPQKLANGRGIAEEAERRTVKRFTQKQIMAEAGRLGDSLTHLADSLLTERVAAGLKTGGVTGALENYPPEKYPEVQALATRFAARPERMILSDKQKLPQRVATLSQTEILYTRPIVYRETTCGPCHGAGGEKNEKRLQPLFPGFSHRPYAAGQTMGYWRVPIKRRAVLEILTLKGMKKPRPRQKPG